MQGNKFFAVIEPGLTVCLFLGLSQTFLSHYHNYYLVGCVLNGAREVFLGQKNFTLLQGDTLLLNPAQIHACASKDPLPFCWAAIFISPEYMRKITQSFHPATLTVLFAQPRSRHDNQPFIYEHFLALKNSIIKKLKWDQENKKFNSFPDHAFPTGISRENIFCSNYSFTNIIGVQAKKILSLVLETTPIVYSSSYHNINQRSFRGYIEKIVNYSENLSGLDCLCKIFEMDKFDLIRKFKNENGISPWRYIEAARVHKSVKLLESTQKLCEISSACGFADQSHFARAFKSRTGLTPGQYRRFTQYKELNLFAPNPQISLGLV